MPIQLPAQAFWAEAIDIEPSLHFTGAGSLKPKLWSVLKAFPESRRRRGSVLQKTDLGILAVPARPSPRGSLVHLPRRSVDSLGGILPAAKVQLDGHRLVTPAKKAISAK